MSALLFLLPWETLVANTAGTTTGSLSLQGMERQKYWESKIRSRRDEPFIIMIGVKWKCSDVCSWGILTDREIWTLFLHDPIDLIGYYPSILFFVQLFDNMKLWTQKLCPPSPLDRRAEEGSLPGPNPFQNWGLTIISQYAFLAFMPFPVHGLKFWCPRRRGTTPTHPELGG